MPELPAADMVGAEFGDEDRIEPAIPGVLPIHQLFTDGSYGVLREDRSPPPHLITRRRMLKQR